MIVNQKFLDCNEYIVTHKLLDCEWDDCSDILLDFNEIIVTLKLLDCNEMILTL